MNLTNIFSAYRRFVTWMPSNTQNLRPLEMCQLYKYDHLVTFNIQLIRRFSFKSIEITFSVRFTIIKELIMNVTSLIALLVALVFCLNTSFGQRVRPSPLRVIASRLPVIGSRLPVIGSRLPVIGSRLPTLQVLSLDLLTNLLISNAIVNEGMINMNNHFYKH